MHCSRPLLTASLLSLFLCATAAASQLCAIVPAPGSSNNGLSNGSVIYFDVTVTNAVQITSYDINCLTPALGQPCSITVYTCATTYVGKTTSPTGWTQVAVDDGTAISAGKDAPTHINLQAPFTLLPGAYGMALAGGPTTGHAYTGTGSGTGYMNFANADLSIYSGASSSTLFGGSQFAPRVFNGCIYYNPACSKKYGSGCQGSGGFVPDLGLTGCPIAGQNVTLSLTQCLGGTNAVFVFGTGQGPLPMGSGCFLNLSTLFPVSFAVPIGGVGAGNGSIMLAGPLPAASKGLTVNMQAFTLDGAGALGFANSNGLEFTVQ